MAQTAFKSDPEKLRQGLILLEGYFNRNGIGPIEAYSIMRVFCKEIEEAYKINNVVIGEEAHEAK